MTREELENNYEYKVTKKALLREFPFVKDVYVKDDDDINKWNRYIYIDLIIDPFALAHQYGFRVWGPVINALRRGDTYMSPYLSIFIGDDDRVVLISPVNKAMEELIEGIHDSPAIPRELKLRDSIHSKTLGIGTFTALPSSLPSNMTD